MRDTDETAVSSGHRDGSAADRWRQGHLDLRRLHWNPEEVVVLGVHLLAGDLAVGLFENLPRQARDRPLTLAQPGGW